MCAAPADVRVKEVCSISYIIQGLAKTRASEPFVGHKPSDDGYSGLLSQQKMEQTDITYSAYNFKGFIDFLKVLV